jgi:hypothetical protein
MGDTDGMKATLKEYLQDQRDALLWKADGLGERELRWPWGPTGTNILGVIKHVASVEFGYFGEVFGRPADEPMPWWHGDWDDNADMFATADQPKEWVFAFYRRAWVHSDATIDALDLGVTGHVSWWPPESQNPTLHHVLVHMIAETARHAGQADIIRELTDGQVGAEEDYSGVSSHDAAWWEAYVRNLRDIATEVGDRPTA